MRSRGVKTVLLLSGHLDHAFDLRAVSRRIEGMVKMATQEKNRLHAATSFDEMSEIVRNDIEVNIRHLERRK